MFFSLALADKDSDILKESSEDNYRIPLFEVNNTVCYGLLHSKLFSYDEDVVANKDNTIEVFDSAYDEVFWNDDRLASIVTLLGYKLFCGVPFKLPYKYFSILEDNILEYTASDDSEEGIDFDFSYGSINESFEGLLKDDKFVEFLNSSKKNGAFNYEAGVFKVSRLEDEDANNELKGFIRELLIESACKTYHCDESDSEYLVYTVISPVLDLGGIIAEELKTEYAECDFDIVISSCFNQYQHVYDTLVDSLRNGDTIDKDVISEVPFCAFLSDVFDWKIKNSEYSNLYKTWFNENMPITADKFAENLKSVYNDMSSSEKELFDSYVKAITECINDDFSIKLEYRQ